MGWGIWILLALIAAAVAVLARNALREDAKTGRDQRGSLPGTGAHILTSQYQSGMGGGNDANWRVPRDPQAYAKRFVPKDAKK